MSIEIEFHDSELLGVDVEAGTLLIDAYIHRSGTEIRREGGYQHTLFRFKNFQTEDKNRDLLGEIYDGGLSAVGFDPRDLVPLPAEIATPVKVAITLFDGREALFLGDGLTIEEAGPYRFLEFWRD
jgi:hypothetical protein